MQDVKTQLPQRILPKATRLTRSQTCYEYLLDLFLTDVAGSEVRVGPRIADHNFLLVSLPLPEVTDLQFTYTVSFQHFSNQLAYFAVGACGY